MLLGLDSGAFCPLIGHRSQSQARALWSQADAPSPSRHQPLPNQQFYATSNSNNKEKRPAETLIEQDGDLIMTENGAPKTGGTAPDGTAAGIPFYEKQRQHLKELIARKRALEKRIVGPTLPVLT